MRKRAGLVSSAFVCGPHWRSFHRMPSGKSTWYADIAFPSRSIHTAFRAVSITRHTKLSCAARSVLIGRMASRAIVLQASRTPLTWSIQYARSATLNCPDPHPGFQFQVWPAIQSVATANATRTTTANAA